MSNKAKGVFIILVGLLIISVPPAFIGGMLFWVETVAVLGGALAASWCIIEGVRLTIKATDD